MDTDNPSIISHVSLGTNNFDRARTFYNAVMTALNCRIVMEHMGAVAYGKVYPEFWLQTPHDGGSATAGNGVHVGSTPTQGSRSTPFIRQPSRLAALMMAPPASARNRACPTTDASCAIRMATRSKPPIGTWHWPRNSAWAEQPPTLAKICNPA